MGAAVNAESGTRTAECGCGRLRVTVAGAPVMIVACHCDFCQKITGSVFKVSALYADDAVTSIDGESTIFNGLQVNGVGPADSQDRSISYHFCPTCGSTVYWTGSDFPGLHGIHVGNFFDPDFPAPVMEMQTKSRHRWLAPVPGATSFEEFPTGVPNT